MQIDMTESPSPETLDLGIPGSGATGFSVSVSSEPVLSAARLQGVLDGVFRLREHWIERSPGFFTLGLALYKDGSALADGRLEVEESNARLEESFGPALTDLKAFMSRELEGEVEWGHALPLPGYHIFDATGLRPGEPTGDAHLDVQYVWGAFDEPVLDVVSVTVPIQVPAHGTSLEYWPVDYAELERLINIGTIADVADAERHFRRHEVSYEPGRACVLRGLPLHRIGRTARVEPSDYRITLQGHAVRLGDRWIAYW
jgi:hypothetical protein